MFKKNCANTIKIWAYFNFLPLWLFLLSIFERINLNYNVTYIAYFIKVQNHMATISTHITNIHTQMLHLTLWLKNLSRVFLDVLVKFKEYWGMYNIKKARNKASHGSEDWIAERLPYTAQHFRFLCFSSKQIWQRNTCFQFCSVKR